jgi:UbiD family decarboxylase
MAYYKNVRDYLQALEKNDKLVRIKQAINKDTEMHPLVRLQYRGLPEEQRRAFLFEKVVDLKGRAFDISGSDRLLCGESGHLRAGHAVQKG